MPRNYQVIENEFNSVLAELKGLLDDQLVNAKQLEFFPLLVFLKAKKELVNKYLTNFNFLSEIPYLNEATKLIEDHYRAKLAIENPLKFDDAEFIDQLKLFILPDNHNKLSIICQKIEDLESEIKAGTASQLDFLCTQSVPAEDVLPTDTEIELLLRTLHMMVYDAALFELDPIRKILIKNKCPIVKEVQEVAVTLSEYNELLDDDLDEKKRIILYYRRRNLQGIDVEKNFPLAIQAIEAVVEKVKLEHSDRDAANAKVICRRIATIQKIVLNKLQNPLKLLRDTIEQQFQVMGLIGIKNEIIELRNQFKDFVPESFLMSLKFLFTSVLVKQYS